MTTQRKLEIIGLFIVVALAAVFAKGWLLEREARTHAEAKSQAQEQIIAHTNDDIATRDAQADQYTQLLKSQQDAIRTPQQAAQVIVRYLPAPAGQPAPTIATVDRSELSPELQASLPDSPSFSLLTPAQLEHLARDELACDATRKTLAACQADETDLRTEVAAKGRESAGWEAAAKGGTKRQRFVQVLKFVGCAGGGAAVGALVDKKSPAIGATVAAGAAVTACSIF